MIFFVKAICKDAKLIFITKAGYLKIPRYIANFNLYQKFAGTFFFQKIEKKITL